MIDNPSTIATVSKRSLEQGEYRRRKAAAPSEARLVNPN
jgi:hypothetical protein